VVVVVVRVLLQAWRPLLPISGASASIYARRVGSSGAYVHTGARQRPVRQHLTAHGRIDEHQLLVYRLR